MKPETKIKKPTVTKQKHIPPLNMRVLSNQRNTNKGPRKLQLQ